MTSNDREFSHICKILNECGYPKVPNSSGLEWFIKIETYDSPCITPHYFDCQTQKRAKTAVKSLLNKTNVYSVTVFHQMPNGRLDRAISFCAGWSILTEYEWEWEWNKKRILTSAEWEREWKKAHSSFIK